MKKTLLKTFCLLLLILITTNKVSSQENHKSSDSFLKNKISLNLGVIPFYESGSDNIKISLNGTYGINHWLEAGLFTETDFFMYHTGIVAKAHLLPIIINPSYYRFDVYANMHFGLGSFNFEHLGAGTGLYLNGGVGASYNITKNIGLFYEINYSNVYYLNHKVGLKLITSQEKKFIQTDSYLKGKTTLSVGSSITQEYGFKQPMVNIEILRGINDWFELGLFTDLGYYKDYIYNIEFRPLVICYGIATRVHILPIIIEQSNIKFDVYANFQFGGKSYIHKKIMIDEYTYTKRASAIYSKTSFGVAYYLNNTTGLFYEIGYSDTDCLSHQLGLSFRL